MMWDSFETRNKCKKLSLHISGNLVTYACSCMRAHAISMRTHGLSVCTHTRVCVCTL